MSFSEINKLRKEGKLKEAYQLALSNYQQDKENIWNKRALAWVYYELLKNSTDRNLNGKIIEILQKIEEISLPPNESTFQQAIAWTLGKYFNKHQNPVDSSLCLNLTPLLTKLISKKPSDAFTFLTKSFVKNCNDKESCWLFFEWVGTDHFQEKDFQKQELDNGKKILSDVEQIFISLSKCLLQEPHDLQKIDTFLPSLSKLCRDHPEMQYTHYYYAKMLLLKGDKSLFLKAFVPFARMKKRDFWVWDLLSEAFDKKDPRHFYCLARSLSCGAPNQFTINVKEKMAYLLFEKNLLAEAKFELEEVIKFRKKNQWKLSDEIIKLEKNPLLKQISATKSNLKLYEQYKKEADAILYYDLDEHIVVIEQVNTEKKVAYFIENQEIYGGFSYRSFPLNLTPGETYSVRFLPSSKEKESHFFKIASIERSEQKPSEKILKTVSGTLQIKKGNSFGFAENIFIPPDLIQKHQLSNGDTIHFKAVYSYNKKKKTWGWKGIALV